MKDCSACCVLASDVADEASDPGVPVALEVLEVPSGDVLESRDMPMLERACVIALMNPPSGGEGGDPFVLIPWLAFELDDPFETLDVLNRGISDVRSEMLLIDM